MIIYVLHTIKFKTFFDRGGDIMQDFNTFANDKKNKQDLKYPIAMMVGSIFCFLGDATIHKSFILGVVLFALGHVFYVVGYCVLQKFSKLDFIIGGSFGLLTCLFVALCPLLE